MSVVSKVFTATLNKRLNDCIPGRKKKEKSVKSKQDFENIILQQITFSL